MHKACLIVILDMEFKPLRAEIWSSAPWEQSMLPRNAQCFVAYETSAQSFQQAHDVMRESVRVSAQYHPSFKILVELYNKGLHELDPDKIILD
jgi:hypothetical protein